ncbi:MAG TPA: LysR family transcriptional regulator [Candidatus Fusicatenibacter intestinigallinarum]|uniref:LysR family transcriptional regulator n=1 Tax=Candidatus Fusicatenibacter intestinigallinarum TaxID=2838598 RepID=A0A9D2N9I1_9FIRM|nr:LysR family transcriptional regulator [Candidatus Fusicatenibacter intestinigallinarum]
MELRQLRYFVTVVEEKTVTAAAEKLNMTQPPLTAQLKLLEKELYCSLFQRKGRRLQVTEAGKHFYQKAAVILGMCDAAAKEMRDFDSGVAGTLQIGVVSSVQEGIFTRWLTAFAGTYPEIRYEIYSANTYQLLEQVRTGQLDLAVVRTPFSARDIGQKVLGEESLMAVGMPDFFDGGNAPRPPDRAITLRELEGKPLILYRRWEQILRAGFEAEGLFPEIRCCTDTAQATLALAGGGLGIGILPASAVSAATRAQMEVRVLREASLSSRIVMICQKPELLSRTARLFWEFMEENVLPEQ